MKIGILGSGLIAGKMAATINGMKEASCYAVASRDYEKAKVFKDNFQFEKAYGSYEELVQDEAVDLVYIATPHSRHFQDAKLCISHKKPVLVEKAFMANAKEAKEIVAYAKQENVFMTEAIWTRFMPSRKIIDDIIADGTIGEVTGVSTNLGYAVSHLNRLIDPVLAGGALLDVGVYTLVFASMFLGDEVIRTSSLCTKTATGVDGQNAMILEYPKGKIATLHSTILVDTDQLGIIYGTKGYLIAYEMNNITKIEYFNNERESQKIWGVPSQISGYEYEVLSAMKAIREGRIETEEAPLAQSIHIMELMDAFRKEWGIVYPFEA